MKISIVTAYYNRRQLLINTLKSISKTSHDDFEVIVVDDGSTEENKIGDLPNEFPFLKVIRVEPEDKWYINPCVPFNRGFKEASGEIVILQNPECFHTSDIISYVKTNLVEEDYFVFGCYSLSEEKTNQITESIENALNITLNNRTVGYDGDDGWYNHSIYRPKAYHFTSAIFKSKLDQLGGFDERYALGYGYDDDEFLHRLRNICQVKMIDNPVVLHQHHYNLPKVKPNLIKIKLQDNSLLFSQTTIFENKIKANI